MSFVVCNAKGWGSLNYYVLTNWPKFGPALPPCSHLLHFGNPPLLRTFKTLHYPIPKSCYFIDS